MRHDYAMTFPSIRTVFLNIGGSIKKKKDPKDVSLATNELECEEEVNMDVEKKKLRMLLMAMLTLIPMPPNLQKMYKGGNVAVIFWFTIR